MKFQTTIFFALASSISAWSVTTCTSTDCSSGCFTHTGSGDSSCIPTNGGVKSFIYDMNCAYLDTYTRGACESNYIGLTYDDLGGKYCYTLHYDLLSFDVGGC
jgi:hypothetical protein